ncbi:hypothetical protein L211DRAFT_852379 [Terfezia boudieri ATCC MYA-4762]|uniref:Uncharacterized protein n=1 Tax=Terfezia boudieri ATCC MYA-4762 TaxID=1051890 RepID=A0A3N4LF74_9PEZI|nr:hypothetical protein L211DRAFT_852379 [Terfezia boudieri ATCC MYA-4762]
MSTLATTGLVYTLNFGIEIMAVKELYVGAAVSRAQLCRRRSCVEGAAVSRERVGCGVWCVEGAAVSRAQLCRGRSCVEGAAVSLRRLIRNGPNGIHLRRYGGYTRAIHSRNGPKAVLVRIDCIEGHTPFADSFN